MKCIKIHTDVSWSMYGEQMTDEEAKTVVMLFDMIDGSERFFLVTLGSVDSTVLTDSAEDFVARHADVFDRYDSSRLPGYAGDGGRHHRRKDRPTHQDPGGRRRSRHPAAE